MVTTTSVGPPGTDDASRSAATKSLRFLSSSSEREHLLELVNDDDDAIVDREPVPEVSPPIARRTTVSRPWASLLERLADGLLTVPIASPFVLVEPDEPGREGVHRVVAGSDDDDRPVLAAWEDAAAEPPG